jgi:hypothetical protein
MDVYIMKVTISSHYYKQAFLIGTPDYQVSQALTPELSKHHFQKNVRFLIGTIYLYNAQMVYNNIYCLLPVHFPSVLLRFHEPVKFFA